MKNSFVMLGLLAVLGALPGVANETTNSVGMKLVRIEPGNFVMGQDGPPADYKMNKHPAKFNDADWDEKPAHRVTISSGFFMGATEVTLAQYRQFKPGYRGDSGAADDAVTGVSWFDAVKFCEWLSVKEGKTYRLPTEAEWEYACRAGTTTLFNLGDALPAGFQKWFSDVGYRERYFPDGKLPPEYLAGSGKFAARVAQTPANALGLFDMHGNVAEWCADWYGLRVIRGGSHSEFTRLLRSANRSAWLPQTSDEKTGFRVVLGELPNGKLLPPAPPPLNAQQVEQSVAKIEMLPSDKPFFAEPKPFVKIPTNSAGPLFSWHNHSPAITECLNGDLLAVWYSCADEGGSELCNVASRLRRGATEWEPASPFWDGADVNDHAPKIWWDGDRTLLHLARGRQENILRTSTDNGATWSKAQVLMPHGEFGNQPIRTREGFLVITHDSRQCSLVISRDGGKTWTFNDVGHRESDFRDGGNGFRYPGSHAPIVQLADGRLMVVSRNDKPEDQAKFGGKSPFSFTSDFGKTWTYAVSEFPAISSVQRQVLMRLKEGPLLLCSFSDQGRDWKQRKGMAFKAADGSEFTGYGLFAAVSFDEGKTWPLRRLLTAGGPVRAYPTIDRGICENSDTVAEHVGYLSAIQTRDGNIQLISSKLHYVFNLAWLKALPAPAKSK
ncbi:MAG: SUMF1/EgtB/PvdO family nonheme iron enzyme [Kiritimatiellaeota bacterium]|nr:SUMF1/EgtB/PvdO family nonheme iron enzyme [Kiritimatiellota bacterium]